ncbi:MAG: DNA-directed RNA polymerase subunit beta [Dehalococcoidia bacterium]
MTISVKSTNGHNSSDSHRDYGDLPNILPIPNLIEAQIKSFNRFKNEGLKEVLDDISPIEDLQKRRFELSFNDHHFDEPKYTADECREQELTYSAPLYVTARLKVKPHGEIKEQSIFVGEVPIMTDAGTFIHNGAERVVVSQLVRSPGAYFTLKVDPNTGKRMASAKLIPYRGAWMEFETSSRDLLSVKVDRRRKTPVTTLLRSLAQPDNPDAPIVTGSDDEIFSLFESVDTDPDRRFIELTMAKDTDGSTREDALIEFYRRLRPGEPPSVDRAQELISSMLFDKRRYEFGDVGRYKMNRKLRTDKPAETDALEPEDIIELIRHLIKINNGDAEPDDIDNLGNRRVRAVGELLQNQVRAGLVRIERVIRDRMITQMDSDSATPSALINFRPLIAAIREFFGGSQLSQFMDQTNPLSELTHKRRLSALGPGGLSRDRAGFDVRDVHHSHYGRICPIETPEGPNIGLLGSLATYAKTNDFGFIETPYRSVLTTINSRSTDLIGHTLTEKVLNSDGSTLLNSGSTITKGFIKRIDALDEIILNVKPYVSSSLEDIKYMSADQEIGQLIAQANTPLAESGEFVDERVECRINEEIRMETPENVRFMDVTPLQLVSVSTALIPFLEHDDVNRALMGSNMQRQSVPLLRPEAPIVSTGMEAVIAEDSGQVIRADSDGTIIESSGTQITLFSSSGEEHVYKLTKFLRSNQGTCIDQRSIVSRGDFVHAGQILADSSSTNKGELALGQNVLGAFMTWEGYNFEDAIVLSERLIREDKFTSLHIEKYDVEARDTKLGPEEITQDIPNVSESALRNLDEEGIVRIGAEVDAGDILVGKITPKGETELSAEEKLLRAIFGEKARDVKDTSLRVKHGQGGKVIATKLVNRGEDEELKPGVSRLVRVWIAQTRKITEGDKMAGRHGNKGVVARILPEEDMPYLEDGTPIDIILNPIGVPSRMNLGQVLETHLGWAAHNLGFRAVTPVFDSAPDTAIEDALAQAWMVQESNCIDPKELDATKRINWDILRDWVHAKGYNFEELFASSGDSVAAKAALEIWLEKNGHSNDSIEQNSFSELKELANNSTNGNSNSAPTVGKAKLIDGRSGESFDNDVTVGYIYMMKLDHLVDDKVHARSIGPYSLITQQPLGGKAQVGGQRFGEMEVWALEAYSAAHNLQEMLTVKSDDVIGRVKTYESIIKGEDVIQPGIPESFHVLIKELQSLGLSVDLEYDSSEDDFDELENFDLPSDLEIARAGLEGLGVEGLSEELDNDNSSEINEDQILQDLAQNLAASQIEESELPENLPTSETLDSEESEEPAE